MSAARALAITFAAWVLMMLAPPGPASAGGPTSALLSVPGEGRTASLYHTEAAYEQLADLVGVNGAMGRVDPSGRNHESGEGITVTWLIHDVTPWRIDHIYLGGKEGPWIATQQMFGDNGSIWDSPVTWHQPAAGKELTQLLNSLGVGPSGEAESSVEPGRDVPAAVEPTSLAPAPAPADDESSNQAPDRAAWGLGGLAAGLAAGLLLAAGWMRARAARADRDDGWDLPAEGVEADPAREWLTSPGR